MNFSLPQRNQTFTSSSEFHIFGLSPSIKAWGKRSSILSLSLFNGRFRALSLINNSIHLGWEHPERVIEETNLREAIREAVEQTEFPGTQVTFLIEDHRFITHTLQVPPMSLSDLLAILERKVNQIKTWEGPAVWRHRPGVEARGKMTVHLEIWPEYIVAGIVQICQDLGLHLRQLAPISALAESQLSTLTVDEGEAALLITTMEGKVTFVAGRDDGSLLWTRYLYPTQDHVSVGERVGTEVNRTIMFITQQTNLSIPNVWFLGENAEFSAEDLQPHVPTPIYPCPINPDWKYWLWVGATLPVNHANNFTPPSVLRAPMMKTFNKAVAAMVTLFLILSVTMSSIIDGHLIKYSQVSQAFSSRETQLHHDQQKWSGHLVALQTQKQWARTISEPTLSPLEGPFLSYLGEVTPEEIILHKVWVSRTSKGWNVELQGSATNNLPTTYQVLERWVGELADSPYFLHVQKTWREKFLTQKAKVATGTASPARYRFTIKGTIS